MKAEFSGKVALVTGAASGIRRATAFLYGERGARVVVSDVSEQGGQETVQMIKDCAERQCLSALTSRKRKTAKNWSAELSKPTVISIILQ
jgi:NAD(P)-dependent dehydrogenase (short-subunit alcohol dehydrogenase family)